jgi:hypothetical protein
MEITTTMEKRNPTLSGWLAMLARCSAGLFILLGLAGCGQAATPAPKQAEPQAPAATATQALPPTFTPLPSPTATEAPTATPEPSATPTEPPTATPLPALAVLADGFNAWCAPQDYDLITPTGPDAPDYARKLAKQGDQLNVPIPAAYCVLAFHFNQAAPQGAVLTIYDSNNPFLRLPLQAADGKPDEVWTTVKHSYVVNPPFWSVVYRLSVSGSDNQELWSNSVAFVKPLPKPCPFGGYPDPVTLYCTITDPWEIEPHPDAKYPYPHTPIP